MKIWVFLLVIVTAACTSVTVRRAAVDTRYEALNDYQIGAYHFTKGAIYPVAYVDVKDGNYYIAGEANFVEGGVKIFPNGTLADTRLYVDFGTYGGWGYNPMAHFPNADVGTLIFRPIEPQVIHAPARTNTKE